MASQPASTINLLKINTIYLELSSLFIVTAALLYTSIYFVVSQISDLQRQTNLAYQEGSGTMEKEMNRLKVIMSVFGFAFILRFAFEFTLSFYV